MVRSWRNQMFIHCPVHIGSQSDAVTGIIVPGLAERMQVCRFHHRLARCVQHQTQSGSCATVIFGIENHQAECRIACIKGAQEARVLRPQVTCPPLPGAFAASGSQLLQHL